MIWCAHSCMCTVAGIWAFMSMSCVPGRLEKNLGIILISHVVWGVCCACSHMCTFAGIWALVSMPCGPGKTRKPQDCPHLPSYLRQAILIFCTAHARQGGLKVSRDSLVSASHFTTGVRGLQTCTVHNFTWASGIPGLMLAQQLFIHWTISC